MKQKLTDLYAKNGTKKVLASLLSILAGLLLGSIVVIIVGLAEQKFHSRVEKHTPIDFVALLTFPKF